MMLMGDEYGHTRHGNNNSYGHDTALNHFQWGQVCATENISSYLHIYSVIIVMSRLEFDETVGVQER